MKKTSLRIFIMLIAIFTTSNAFTSKKSRECTTYKAVANTSVSNWSQTPNPEDGAFEGLQVADYGSTQPDSQAADELQESLCTISERICLVIIVFQDGVPVHIIILDGDYNQ